MWGSISVLLDVGDFFLMKVGKLIGNFDFYVVLLWVFFLGVIVVIFFIVGGCIMGLVDVIFIMIIGFKVMLLAIFIFIMAWFLVVIIEELYVVIFFIFVL